MEVKESILDTKITVIGRFPILDPANVLHLHACNQQKSPSAAGPTDDGKTYGRQVLDGRAHGAPYRGHGYVPLRLVGGGGDVVRPGATGMRSPWRP